MRFYWMDAGKQSLNADSYSPPNHENRMILDKVQHESSPLSWRHLIFSLDHGHSLKFSLLLLL